KADGFELAAAVDAEGLSLQANYTYTDAKNDSPGSANRGRTLARRPRHTANLWADYTWPVGVSAGVGISYVGDAFDDAANTFVLEDHALVDIRAAWPLSETVEVYGRVENVF